MNIKIIALGKIKEKFLKEGVDEFLKRLTPYSSVEIVELTPVEIKDENLTEKALDEEGEKILSLIKASSFVITLEIGGKMFSSIARICRRLRPVNSRPLTVTISPSLSERAVCSDMGRRRFFMRVLL